MLSIRSAKTEDAAWIHERGSSPSVLYSPSDAFYSIPSLRALLEDSDHFLLLAERDSQPTGFLLVELSPPNAWLEYHWGDAESLRALSREALARSAARGARWVRALVREGDEGARQALAAEGFREGYAYLWLELELPPDAAALLPSPEPPEGVEVRRATPRDAEAFFSLAQPERDLHMSARWSYSPEEFHAALASPEGVAFAAFESGRLLGFVLSSIDGHAAEFDDIVVSPEARDRGIGTALGLALLHELARRDVRLVYGFVRADNTTLLQRYQLHGARRGDTYVLYERSPA